MVERSFAVRTIESETAGRDDHARRFQFLREAGAGEESFDKLVRLYENGGTDEEKICVLRKIRFEILGEIHRRQQDLDCLDYMIYQMKRNEKC